MSSNLAIATPVIGAPSETFIRRHIEDLLPSSSVVIAHTADKPFGGDWKTNCPTFITDVWRKKSHLRQMGASLAKKLNLLELDIFTVSAIKEFLRLHQAEAILGEYLNNSFDFFKIAQKLEIPYFAHAHGVDISVALRQAQWQKKYLKYFKAAGVITVSEFSRSRLIKLGLSSTNIHVIPCGVDVPAFPKIQNDRNEIYCLAVGRMVPKKAPLLLLHSFQMALKQRPELRLDYVGGGPLLTSAQQFVDENQLQKQIILHGVQPPSFVQHLMQQSDVFLQHSVVDPETGDEEGLPVSILEAMANALPVISTRHTGIPEAVLEGETGFLVNEGDAVEMAQHIITLCENYSLRVRMGVAGWQRASALFSWQKEREALLKLMRLKQ